MMSWYRSGALKIRCYKRG